MPSGSEAFEKRKAQAAAGSAGNDSFFKADYFQIAANTYAPVRFLEQGDDLTFVDVHKIPVVGREWPQAFICLNSEGDGTPCPACESPDQKIKRTTGRGRVNVIWRDGPVYERNEWGGPKKIDGKPVITGRADGVFLWDTSWDVFEALMEKDHKYKGLMSRDWDVKRTGVKKDTKYFLEPSDPDGGPKPMSVADLALAAGKYDLKAACKPMGYVELHAIINGAAPAYGPQPTMDQSQRVAPTANSVFAGDTAPRASAFSRG